MFKRTFLLIFATFILSSSASALPLTEEMHRLVRGLTELANGGVREGEFYRRLQAQFRSELDNGKLKEDDFTSDYVDQCLLNFTMVRMKWEQLRGVELDPQIVTRGFPSPKLEFPFFRHNTLTDQNLEEGLEFLRQSYPDQERGILFVVEFNFHLLAHPDRLKEQVTFYREVLGLDCVVAGKHYNFFRYDFFNLQGLIDTLKFKGNKEFRESLRGLRVAKWLEEDPQRIVRAVENMLVLRQGFLGSLSAPLSLPFRTALFFGDREEKIQEDFIRLLGTADPRMMHMIVKYLEGHSQWVEIDRISPYKFLGGLIESQGPGGKGFEESIKQTMDALRGEMKGDSNARLILDAASNAPTLAFMLSRVKSKVIPITGPVVEALLKLESQVTGDNKTTISEILDDQPQLGRVVDDEFLMRALVKVYQNPQDEMNSAAVDCVRKLSRIAPAAPAKRRTVLWEGGG